MLMEPWHYVVLHCVALAIQATAIWWQIRSRRLLSRYAVYNREGLRLLRKAASSARSGYLASAEAQEQMAREWLARADQQPDAPPEVRAVRELAEIE